MHLNQAFINKNATTGYSDNQGCWNMCVTGLSKFWNDNLNRISIAMTMTEKK
jgi:hypothetical protein